MSLTLGVVPASHRQRHCRSALDCRRNEPALVLSLALEVGSAAVNDITQMISLHVLLIFQSITTVVA